MKMTQKILSLTALALAFSACEQYQLPTIAEPTGGGADFSKVVVVGNSIAAGFMNGALYEAGQANSFPALIAGQLEWVGGGAFSQPDVTGAVNGCYNPAGGCTLGRLYLKLVGGSPTPTPKTGELAALAPYAGDKAALNNFSVPGLTVQTALTPLLGGPAVLPGPTANPVYNPYYVRFASNAGTSTLIGDAATAMAGGGSFLIFSLGLNDVLGYAIGGAATSSLLTSTAAFSAAYNGGLNALLAAAPTAKGVVSNIPDVTDLPYFNTVAYNPVPLTNQAQVDLLNGPSGFQGYNTVLDALLLYKAAFQIPDAVAAEIATRKVTYSNSKNNKILIYDETLVDLGTLFDGLVTAQAITQQQRAGLEPYRRVRQSRPTDKVLLTAATVLGTTIGGNPLYINGVTLPLGYGESDNGDKYILLPSEITQIQTRISEFNLIIGDAVGTRVKNVNTPAADAQLALVDLYSALKKVKSGAAASNGSSLSLSLAPPYGIFSLDGLHPNARGSGYYANLYIESINRTFKSTIPLVNLNDLPGNELPIP